MDTNESLAKIGNYVNSKMLKYELILLFIALLSIILKLFVFQYPDFVITIILEAISIIYFLSVFANIADNSMNGLDKFFLKIIGLGSAIILIGILFRIQKWPNSNAMLYVGFFTLIIALIYILTQRIKTTNSKHFNVLLIIRVTALIITSIGILFWY